MDMPIAAPDFNASVLLCKGISNTLEITTQSTEAKLFTENILFLNPGKNLSIADLRLVTWKESSDTVVAIVSASLTGFVGTPMNEPHLTMFARGSWRYVDNAIEGAVGDMLAWLQERVARFARPLAATHGLGCKVTVSHLQDNVGITRNVGIESEVLAALAAQANVDARRCGVASTKRVSLTVRSN